MSDYAQYHALGHGEVDPNDPNRQTAPAPPQFQPPVAHSPYQQQGGMPYGSPQQQYQQQMGGLPQQPQPGMMSPGSQYQEGQDASLAAQMGGMNIGDGQTTVRKKKKDRHAYHTVEATGSSQAFNGMPQAGTPASQFLDSNPTQQGGQFGAQGMGQTGQGQFPNAPQQPFSPGAPTTPGFAGPNNASNDAAATISTSGSAQVSPDDMPSVPTSRDSVQQHYLRNVYPTFERHVPPPASVSFVAFDQGNASPKFARLTLNNIPATSDGLTATGLPLGLLLQPLAAQQAGESEIPVLDFGEPGPPRCRRCRAYINPFMMFRNGGNKFVCNLCTHPNEVTPEYFCATSPQGVRVDRDQRPELHRGTVEFVVPKEYWTKEPVGLRWLFLIDATQESYNKGFLESFCDGILAALYGGEDAEMDDEGKPKRRIPEGAKVGFVTYDKDIQFYNLSVSGFPRTLYVDN